MMIDFEQLRPTIKARRDYFLKKIKTRKALVKFFEKIPANKWCVNMMYNEDNSKSCALGHLGFGGGTVKADNQTQKHLSKIFNDDYGTHTLLLSANDTGKTNPKRRVINFVKNYKGSLEA